MGRGKVTADRQSEMPALGVPLRLASDRSLAPLQPALLYNSPVAFEALLESLMDGISFACVFQFWRVERCDLVLATLYIHKV